MRVVEPYLEACAVSLAAGRCVRRRRDSRRRPDLRGIARFLSLSMYLSHTHSLNLVSSPRRHCLSARQLSVSAAAASRAQRERTASRDKSAAVLRPTRQLNAAPAAPTTTSAPAAEQQQQ